MAASVYVALSSHASIADSLCGGQKSCVGISPA
jgi:hypothetical protein